MHAIRFWKSWHKPDQYVLGFLALLLLISMGYFLYAYLSSPAPAITWEKYQQLQTEEVTLRSFDVGIQKIEVPADNFTVFEVLSGSEMNITPFYFHSFLLFFTLSLIVLLAIITTVSRFWFLIGMGVFSLLVISLQLESLQIPGLTNKLAAAALIVPTVGLAYFFHAFRSTASFIMRAMAFAGLFVMLGLVITWVSTVQDPLLHISVNGYTLATLLTIIFILMVGPEIPAAFINLLTQGTRQTKTLRHFTIIGSVYLLNLLISYGIETGYLDWNILVIDFFLLFTVSAILGIWGFRQREHQYEDILPANPLGIYLILSMTILAFATLGLYFITVNDTVSGVMHDFILYSHLGYGIIFIFYVIANFGSMLSQNLQVYKVLYKPNTMHYVTFRIMGLITCFAFLVFDTSYRTVVDQLYAAYYNQQGDLYYHQNNSEVAEAYYNRSVFYRNQNHHAHYALSFIQASRLEPQKMRQELTKASSGNPTEFAFVNLSESYERSGYRLESLSVLIEGTKKFPNSGPIYNELGRLYLKLNLADSALLSFQEARKSNLTRDLAETNLLAASAHFRLAYPADSLLQLLGSSKPGPQANALALANIQSLPIDIPFKFDGDTVLSATRAAWLCNLMINQAPETDTANLTNAVMLARKSSNFAFKEAIIVAAAQSYYVQGYVKRAFDLVREMAYSTGHGKYFFLLGTWALEQGNSSVAADYFKLAEEKNIARADVYRAIANTEADSLQKAVSDWDSLSRSSDPEKVKLANSMKAVLQATPEQVTNFSDSNKYAYIRYRIKPTDTVGFWKLTNSLDHEHLKAKAILDFSKKWYALDEPELAARIIAQVQGLKLGDRSTYDQILILNMMLLAELEPGQFLKQDLGQALPVHSSFVNELTYLKSLQFERTGEIEQARAGYERLNQANAYFEEGLIASARFFANDSTDRLKPYSILVSGLMVRPNSIKLLKEYIKQAALLGFDDEADESLTKLRGLLSSRSFNRYIEENPDFFSINN